MKADYDYIIAGAGCAGLSFLTRLISTKKFSEKKILLVDREEKNKNDRTWCFWEKQAGFFDDIVYHRWDKLWFHNTDFSRRYEISPYQYKMIRGVDFYRHCFDLIRQNGNVHFMYGEVESIISDDKETSLLINGRKITANFIFNSILFPSPVQQNSHNLLQHFHGWVVEMDNAVFNPAEATLMDFRTSQQEGVTFVYVMPFSDRTALIEYTLFSSALLSIDRYEAGLTHYIDRFYPGTGYSIVEKEFGVIPMTTWKFKRANHHIINIGTAGGQTKASSGYTFQFIQKQSARMVENLLNGDHPAEIKSSPGKFDFYDSVLLNVLATGKLAGNELFARMFQKNKIQDIFAFLDNESSLFTDLSIIASLPVIPFLKAGYQETVKKSKISV